MLIYHFSINIYENTQQITKVLTTTPRLCTTHYTQRYQAIPIPEHITATKIEQSYRWTEQLDYSWRRAGWTDVGMDGGAAEHL